MGGLFNGELLSLFGIYRIAMPPLVNRQEEFHEIAKEILAEIRLEIKKSYIQDFSPLALEKLKSHSWPGNIRELRNVIQLAAVQCEQPQIQVADLPHFEDSKVNLRATRDEFGKIYYSELLNIYKRDLYKVASITGVSLDDLTEKLKSLGLDTK
jgi:DNA-binding NtrC family response regulator